MALAMAGCATTPAQHFAARSGGVDAKYGVAASPRVVADGQAVKPGGGRYFIGKPYTIAGHTYYPSDKKYTAIGMASWYGADFHGRRTANGEVFDRMSLTAANKTMPLPSYARVTNLRNNHSMIVRVNDRGPYAAGRVMDVSERVAEALDFKRAGTAKVKVEYVGRAALGGSDNRKLMASLRVDGQPANLDGGVSIQPATMLALATPLQPLRQVPALPANAAPVQQLALAEPDVVDAPLTANRTQRAQNAALQHVPLPPERPFDLGTIPGAGSRIHAANRPKQVAKFYESAPKALSRHFVKAKPFAGAELTTLQQAAMQGQND